MGIRELAILLIGIVTVVVMLAPRPALLRAGFYFWIATFVVGWRQIWITSNLKIHPAEAVIWFLFLVLFVQRITQQKPIVSWLPLSYGLFLLLGIVGLFNGIYNHVTWDVILSEFKSFLVVIPILYVSREVIESMADLRRALIVFTLTAVFVATLGIVEHYAPGWVAPLSGYFGNNPILYSQQGFARANFTFFGGAIASIFLVTVWLVNLSLVYSTQHRWVAFLWLAGAVMSGFAIYLSGNRAPWVGAFVGLCIFVLFDLRRRGVIVLAGLALLPLLPQQFYHHLWAVVDPTRYYDTSVLKRRQWFQSALDLTWHNPIIGRGWGSSGWVHSDLLQIAANLGVPALALFLLWYVDKIYKLVLVVRKSASSILSTYAAGILSGLIAVLICLSAESIILLPQLIVPIWFLLALADATVRLAATAEV
jgi:O-antigen ligase